MKNTVWIILISFASGILGTFVYHRVIGEEVAFQTGSDLHPRENQVVRVNDRYPSSGNSPLADMGIDFVEASRLSTQSVVYIRNLSEQSYAVSWMDLFFGGQPNKEVRVSSGSGVIFSSDGYILSNNHVVEDADKIEVIYNKQTYEAELIGVDASTDLAVLKIDAKNLPVIERGSSKDLKVGEWVIAVGNPFNLTSTVTAGIVSAKGRQINILKEKFPIESFIQTDAAINPGNSGGALVNKEGKLVGINTAIFSRTGSYVGYGFAVPVDIAHKVFDDIVRYGELQKAFLGGEVEDFNSEIASRLDIQRDGNYEGVLLVYLQKEGAAAKAGLKEGDLITAINQRHIESRGIFEEELSYRSPGDNIEISYERDGKNYTTKLTLTNREGTTDILKRKIVFSKTLGAEFEEVSKVERDILGIESGVRVFNITTGRLYGIDEDFIITHINRTSVNSASKLIDILENVEGLVYIEGVGKNGQRGRYRFYGK